ncbi:MAG: tetratricopeptide repeat protein [Anaerolineaceae bacterium]|nr:tetratricopeptide repeat protein [Anaerolineaceae bacterium]
MIRNYSTNHPTPFVGRAKELAEIVARLANPECRLLTLTGLGGSGKTRLAVEAAKAVAQHFTDGAIFVGLQSLSRGDLLIPALAQSIGMIFYGPEDLQSQLIDHLHDKKLLLLLDNFEHLLDKSEIVNVILRHALDVKVLVTSREALNLQQEWLYPLKGMLTPPSVYIYPTIMEDYEAVQLFLYHARRVQPDFNAANEQAAIIDICNMTAGLPLAIELAASWLKGLSATQIAHEIQRSLSFLSTTTRNVEERHRSMRAVFDHSWKLLPKNERQILARLSLFVGGFDAEAALSVAGADFSDLSGLVEKSLIQLESANRFSTHEILRQYSLEKLQELGENHDTTVRFCQYFAQFMVWHEAQLKQAEQLDSMRAIETEFDNVRVAWEWATKNHQANDLHEMLHGLYLFGFLSSRYRETCSLFQQALDAAVGDQSLRGRLLSRRWGYLHWWYLSNYHDALIDIQQAIGLMRAANDAFEIAFDNLVMGYVMNGLQRYSEALTHFETSKTQFEAINEPYYTCWALHRLGYVYASFNDLEKSTRFTEQSLILARSSHNRVALVICLYNLGSDCILEGDYPKGKTYCEEALLIARETHHQGQIAHALSLIALCEFFEGNYASAQSNAEQSYRITEDINMLVFIPYSLSVLTLLACLREDYLEGARLNDLDQNHQTNLMGYQLLHWALAILSCGLGHRAEAQLHTQAVLRLTERGVSTAVIVWIIPSVIYVLSESNPRLALELVAWVNSYPNAGLNWVRQWQLLVRLQDHLRQTVDTTVAQQIWERGTTHSLQAVEALVRQHYSEASTDNISANTKLLTMREQEILHLLADGLTNPQIAERLIIATGTVKTHTLSIYRKLDVANRTQAIIRAQELGLL